MIGRHVFYNDSTFDGNDPAAGAGDDDAIAADKRALRPGQTAGFANYTSYTRGINGIMVDVARPPGSITADDFVFKVGNDNDPDAWDEAPWPDEVTVRPGEGVDRTDRVTITWPDGAIRNQWLQVTVLPDANTGLLQPDVFYYGNAVGESGNSGGDAKVNAFDMLAARDNQRTFLDPAPIDMNYDYDRNARVDATDMLIARNNTTHFLNALRLITVPAAKRGEGAAAGDVVIEQPWGRESGSRGASPGALEWLDEFELIGRRRRPAEMGNRAMEILDLLLAGMSS